MHARCAPLRSCIVDRRAKRLLALHKHNHNGTFERRAAAAGPRRRSHAIRHRLHTYVTSNSLSLLTLPRGVEHTERGLSIGRSRQCNSRQLRSRRQTHWPPTSGIDIAIHLFALAVLRRPLGHAAASNVYATTRPPITHSSATSKPFTSRRHMREAIVGLCDTRGSGVVAIRPHRQSCCTRLLARRRAGGNVHTSHISVSYRPNRRGTPRSTRAPSRPQEIPALRQPTLAPLHGSRHPFGAATHAHAIIGPRRLISSRGTRPFGGRRGGAARGVANAARSRRPSRGPEAGGLPAAGARGLGDAGGDLPFSAAAPRAPLLATESVSMPRPPSAAAPAAVPAPPASAIFRRCSSPSRCMRFSMSCKKFLREWARDGSGRIGKGGQPTAADAEVQMCAIRCARGSWEEGAYRR